MCGCFEKMKESVSGQIKEKIGDHVEFKGDFGNKVFFFGENPPKIPVVIPFKSSYRQIRTNGEPYKNLTNKETSIVMNFCPFCGKEAN